MKKIAIVITIVVVFLTAGYLAYDKWYKYEVSTLWDNVPGNAVIVFESGHTIESWQQLKASRLWNSLQRIEAFSNIDKNIEGIDSISSRARGVAGLLGKNSLISLHVTGKNNFDFTFFIDLNNPSAQNVATDLLEHFKSKKEVTYAERIYQDFKISELTSSARSFTYFINNNVLVGSFTSFLVEDVVRLVKNDYKGSFKQSNYELFDLPKLSNDDGNLYINMESTSLWLSTFLRADKRKSARNVQNLGRSLFLDMDLSEDKLLLNGFTTFSSNIDFLSTFNAQKPVKADVKYYIPNRASWLYQLAFTDPEIWHNELKKYWGKYSPQFLTARRDFEQEYNLDFSKIYDWIGTSVSLVQLEPLNFSENERITLVHCSDVTEALNQLNTFSESLAQAHGDSVYVENFAEYEIRELKAKDFPKNAFGPQFDGYDECYFTLMGDYIVMATSMQTLKTLVEDLEGENTWGRSVSYNNFLESTLEESNISLIFNTRRVWMELTSQADSRWQQFSNENEQSLKSFGLGSVQFSRLDENFYTSIALQHEDQPQPKEKKVYDALKSTELSNKIITKPYVVKNHTNNGLEVAVQDSAYNFVLIGVDGNVLWRDSLGQAIVSDIEQVDYYKNGKLQYFFATKSALHIIDRLGNYIDGYPVRLENVNIKYASVVDYDKSKRYRFLLGDERGNLYLFNKEGISLEGWSPRELTGKLASKPFHIRVRGKDCIVAIQQDGVVNVMNRRGEMMPGFPLNVDARINTKPFVNIGSDFDKTIFTLLSREGRLIRFNLSGTIVSTEQLYKPTKETRFELIPDALDKTYIIARQDMSRLVLLSPDHKEIISKDYLSSGQLYVQYYDLGSDHKIYAITDKAQDFTYIYDGAGKLISSRPIDSEQEIALMYFDSTGKYQVYVVSADTFKVLSF
ncbi:hypothetical protein C900_02605 [Fulvivirga imtechensis AK7]|uniref:Uncharacterized protein n=1 Tax=Fulvivirga imtechensis AK7 TaxID=1237149 RepID=L8JXK2_9BACT|nr:DUF3352 domain-containing protein [Fulvivirga imtechensis]ELR73520.1 hypothetical protein C900_02605 [Fulvivirga imtechensis AK7]